jgi:WD40 repeat protein
MFFPSRYLKIEIEQLEEVSEKARPTSSGHPRTAAMRKPDETISAHTGTVMALGIAPDAQSAVSASRDGTLKFWNVRPLKQVYTVRAHDGGAFAAAFAFDGTIVASGGADGTVRLWAFPSGELLQSLQTRNRWVVSVDITPNGRRVVAGGLNGALQAWDIATGNLVHDASFEMPNPGQWPPPVLTEVAAVDNRMIVAAGWTSSIMLWDLSTGVRLRRLGEEFDRVAALAPSPNRQTLVSLSDTLDATYLNVWNLKTGKRMTSIRLDHQDRVTSLKLFPNGWALTGSQDGTARIWDLVSGSLQDTLDQASEVSALAVSPDDKTILTGGDDGRIRAWFL